VYFGPGFFTPFWLKKSKDIAKFVSGYCFIEVSNKIDEFE